MSDKPNPKYHIGDNVFVCYRDKIITQTIEQVRLGVLGKYVYEMSGMLSAIEADIHASIDDAKRALIQKALLK